MLLSEISGVFGVRLPSRLLVAVRWDFVVVPDRFFVAVAVPPRPELLR